MIRGKDILVLTKRIKRPQLGCDALFRPKRILVEAMLSEPVHLV